MAKKSLGEELEEIMELRSREKSLKWEYSCSSNGSCGSSFSEWSDRAESTLSDESYKQWLSTKKNSRGNISSDSEGCRMENMVVKPLERNKVLYPQHICEKAEYAKTFLNIISSKKIDMEKVSTLTSVVVGQVEVAEVTNAEGTKRMYDIKCPTVVIKVDNMYFTKATVHYVLLEPKSGEFEGQIPALLLSNPSAINGKTQTAELLPLVMQIVEKPAGTVNLIPMLRYDFFQGLFKNTSKLLLMVFKLGRQFSPVGEQMLKTLLYKDIQMMPKEVLRAATPLLLKQKVTNEFTSSRARGLRNNFTPKRLSEIYTDRRLPGLKVYGANRDFARWFEAVPPNAVIDVNFKCDDNGIFKKDYFQNTEMLDAYLGLSRMI